MSALTLVMLFAVVFLGFAVESALGFGAGLVSVSGGALLMPLDDLLHAFIPLNVLLSLYLAVRYRRDINTRILLRSIVPLVALGMPIGMFAVRALPGGVLKVGLGLFIATLAFIELMRMRGGRTGEKPASWFRSAMLVLGGAVHGAFATGGPMVVYAAGFDLPDKSAFRATLALLWVLLNLVLVGSYIAAGALTAATGLLSVKLACALGLGTLVGEWLHRRVPARTFRVAVYVLLLCAGAVLVARNAGALTG